MIRVFSSVFYYQGCLTVCHRLPLHSFLTFWMIESPIQKWLFEDAKGYSEANEFEEYQDDFDESLAEIGGLGS